MMKSRTLLCEGVAGQSCVFWRRASTDSWLRLWQHQNPATDSRRVPGPSEVDLLWAV